jgi:AraC-like DNA-binding protein
VLVDTRCELGALAYAQMQGVMSCAAALPTNTARRLSSTVAELIAISVNGEIPTREQSRLELRRAFHETIVRHVEAQALDPTLSVEAVAARFRVSPRYVHGVFAERAASFTHTVLERRLANAARALRESSASIAEIAMACGFGDLSHFGRAFRRRFGCTPREWRRDGSC